MRIGIKQKTEFCVVISEIVGPQLCELIGCRDCTRVNEFLESVKTVKAEEDIWSYLYKCECWRSGLRHG